MDRRRLATGLHVNLIQQSLRTKRARRHARTRRHTQTRTLRHRHTHIYIYIYITYWHEPVASWPHGHKPSIPPYPQLMISNHPLYNLFPQIMVNILPSHSWPTYWALPLWFSYKQFPCPSPPTNSSLTPLHSPLILLSPVFLHSSAHFTYCAIDVLHSSAFLSTN